MKHIRLMLIASIALVFFTSCGHRYYNKYTRTWEDDRYFSNAAIVEPPAPVYYGGYSTPYQSGYYGGNQGGYYGGGGGYYQRPIHQQPCHSRPVMRPAHGGGYGGGHGNGGYHGGHGGRH